jgi:hypothetical protein
LKIIAAIVDPAVITKILTHLHLPARAPPISAARRVDLFQGPDRTAASTPQPASRSC